jgi:hypothetical protein
MSNPGTSSKDTLFDFTTSESRRREFRKLVLIAAVCTLVALALSFTAPVSQQLQEALEAEIESLPEWRFWTGLAAGIGIYVGCLLYGLYRLWSFKADGAGYVAFAAFFPLFLLLPLPSVASPFGSYVATVSSIVLGMLLFASWSMPDVFAPAISDSELRGTVSEPKGLQE